jgi:protease-4
MLKNMSDAQKEATNALLDSFYGQIVQAVAEGRRLSQDQVRDDINVGFLWGDQIQKMRLVDGLWYRDQVEDALKKINGNSDRWNSIDIADYVKDHRVNLAAGAKKSLALVIASGDIVSGEGDGTKVQTESNLGSDTVIRWLRKVGRRSDISGVVLRVDSPGGSGLASDMMWRQIQVLRKSKPVVVSMSDLAASGGYYISMGADAIVAQPGTITGSIGVVTGKFVIKGLLDHIDYNQETLKRGANSDMFSGYTPFDKEQEALINQQMQAFYHDFVSKAAEGRKMTYDQVDSIGRGRVWSGEDALKLGLVDKLGGLHTAIQVAKEKAGIPKNEPVQIVVYPQPKTFFEAFFQDKMDAMVHADAVSKLPPELYEAYQNYEALRPLASEPFVLYTPVKVHL